MRINCKDCACWSPDPDTDGQYGTCRQSPPTVVDRKYCLWPATTAEDWCGQAYSSDIVDVEERAYTAVRRAGYNAAIEDAIAMLTAKAKKTLVVQAPDASDEGTENESVL